jgi:hypothetical protein
MRTLVSRIRNWWTGAGASNTPSRYRKLRCEYLEERSLLATFGDGFADLNDQDEGWGNHFELSEHIYFEEDGPIGIGVTAFSAEEGSDIVVRIFNDSDPEKIVQPLFCRSGLGE